MDASSTDMVTAATDTANHGMHVDGPVGAQRDIQPRTHVPHTVGANNYSPLPPVAPSFRSPTKTIGSVVRGFKIGVTKWMRTNTQTHDVWQRNFYDHIIRDDNALNRIRQYIADNPAQWAEDAENPARWPRPLDRRDHGDCSP